jgi:hypothetical protein
MPRTADRPLPAGRIRPIEACLFGLLLAVAGIALPAIDVNILTASLGAVTLITYLFLYTPAKRYTTLCTLLGAIPGAIPVMMGCTAATQDFGDIARPIPDPLCVADPTLPRPVCEFSVCWMRIRLASFNKAPLTKLSTQDSLSRPMKRTLLP